MTDRINTRELVLDILLAVIRDKEYSHTVINGVLDKYSYLPKQERAFITRLSEGTLEHLIELDYIIDGFSKTKVSKMKPVIRCILRMGVYQLKYMDSVPNSAACNEAVKLAQKRGFKGLKGFVNGVMRNISRNLDQFRMPEEETEPGKYLSVCFSLPSWLADKWILDYGYEQTKEMARAFMEPSRTVIRTNLLLTTPGELKKLLEGENVTVKPHPELEEAFVISGYDSLQSLRTFQEGLFYVQDTASMTAARQLEAPKGAFVIDVCAAPGGKSIHMAEKLEGTGMVEARDLTDSKVELIKENIRRCRLENIRARRMDATIKDEASVGKADIVIADLPCSGLGVIGRKPDIRYRITPEDIRELAGLQRRILGVVQSYVKPGGLLLYSTCTVSREENQENAEWFEAQYPEFVLEDARQLFPKAGIQDGFYTARFRKVKEWKKQTSSH